MMATIASVPRKAVVSIVAVVSLLGSLGAIAPSASQAAHASTIVAASSAGAHGVDGSGGGKSGGGDGKGNQGGGKCDSHDKNGCNPGGGGGGGGCDPRDSTQPCHPGGGGGKLPIPTCPGRSAHDPDRDHCWLPVQFPDPGKDNNHGLGFDVPVSRDGKGIGQNCSLSVTVAPNGQFALNVNTPDGKPVASYSPPITASPPAGLAHPVLQELTKNGFATVSGNQIGHPGVFVWVAGR